MNTPKDTDDTNDGIRDVLDALDIATAELPPSVFEGPKLFVGDGDLLDEFVAFVNTDGRCSARKGTLVQFDTTGTEIIIASITGSIGAVATVLVAYLKTKNKKAVFDHSKGKFEFQNYDSEEVVRMLKHSGRMRIRK